MITSDGRAAMGGDVQIRSPRPLSEEELNRIAKILPAQALRTRVTSFNTMLRDAASGSSRFIRLDAVGDSYPLTGEFDTDPPDSISKLGQDAWVIVPDAVMKELELELGQEVFIGEQGFKVLASLKSKSGDFSGFGSFAPRLYIHENFLESTGLFDQMGRIFYQIFLALPEGQKVDARLIEGIKAIIDDPFVAVRSFEESNRAFQRIYSQFELFAYLVILAGFLLASFALHSTLQAWFQERYYVVAVLRSLGATRRQMRAFWMVAVLGITIFSSLMGLGLGSFIQFFLEPMLAKWIPFEPRFVPNPGIYAGLLAVVVSVHALLAASEMAGVDRLKPLLLLRSRNEEISRTKNSWPWIFGLILFFWVLTWLFLQDFWKSLYVIGGLFAFLSLSSLFSGVLFWMLARIPWSSNLYFAYAKRSILRRPKTAMLNASLLATIAFLLTTLILVERNLQEEFQEDRQDRQSDLMIFDLGEEEKEKVDYFLEAYPVTVNWAPWVSLRWLEHNDREVDRINESGFANEIQVSFVEQDWPSHNIVVEGRMWKEPYREGPVEVSVIKSYARNRSIQLGDRLRFSLYGVEFDAIVTNLRHVRFTDFRPFFRFVFQSGFFDGLPFSFLGSIETSSDQDRRKVFRDLVREFPSYSVIDLSEVRLDLRRLIQKMVLALSFILGFLLILSLVLMGAFARSRVYEKRFELAVMKSFGGRSFQLSAFFGLEFFMMAFVSVVFGFLAGFVAAYFLLREFFGIYVISVPSVLWFVPPVIIFLVVAVAMLYSRSLYRIKAKTLLGDI